MKKSCQPAPRKDRLALVGDFRFSSAFARYLDATTLLFAVTWETQEQGAPRHLTQRNNKYPCDPVGHQHTYRRRVCHVAAQPGVGTMRAVAQRTTGTGGHRHLRALAGLSIIISAVSCRTSQQTTAPEPAPLQEAPPPPEPATAATDAQSAESQAAATPTAPPPRARRRAAAPAPATQPAQTSQCPDGSEPAGAPPPAGFEAWCQKRLADGSLVKHGPWRRWWDNGAPAAEGDYSNGQKIGMWILWSRAGTKTEEGAYEGDAAHGHWTFWHANGRKKAEGDYEHGQRRGHWELWDDNGQLVEEPEY